VNLRQQNLSGAHTVRGVAWLAPALLLFTLSACNGGAAEPAPTPTIGITVETGGMALPGAAAEAAPADANAPAAAEAAAPTATERPVLAAGAALVIDSPAAMYAEPDPTSPRLAEYAAGSNLTVIEPDGDYLEYPVIVEGQRWYRVRAEDGLVGWVVEA
jgi:hypothetical protein